MELRQKRVNGAPLTENWHGLYSQISWVLDL